MSQMDVSAEEFFIHSGSSQLEKVYGWARSRYASPWAVFYGVLLRVAASVPPNVQLPPIIGDNASLNLLCAFVGQSGTGKGNTTKVAALTWPKDILTLPIGSGQGIAEAFTKRNPTDEVHPVIFDIPEVDTLTGLSSAKGSILLPTLKSLAMGEQLGQANATKDAQRNVPAHSYRACLSVGVQPGHADVIFNDTSGGTPQRFLWVPVTDPHILDGEFSDPTPLVTDMPIWTPRAGGIVEIVYSAPEIERAVILNHIARQRGDGDALDGHAVLTRCKVAALLAIMHQRVEVSEWDWQLSAAVMSVSDQTRLGLIRAAEDIKRQRELEAGAARAVRSEGYEVGRVQLAKRAIVERLKRQGGDGIARNDLRTSLSTAHRQVFDVAIQELAEDGLVSVITVKRGTRYRLTDSGRGGDIRQGQFAQVKEGGSTYQGGAPDNLVCLENHRSQKSGGSKVSCQKWFDGYLAERRERGHDTVEAVAVREAGEAAGYKKNQLYVAANSRGYKGTHWTLTG